MKLLEVLQTKETLSKYCAQSACPTGVAVAPWSRSLRLLGALWWMKCQE